MSILKKIWQQRSVFRNLPYSIYFNFRYLPFIQAVKIPILLYKPKVYCGGRIVIEAPVSFGMIRLGFNQVSIYPNTGVVWENRGEIKFTGKATVGNASSLSVGENGHLIIGNGLVCSCGLKMVAYNRIELADNVRIGWDTKIVDTDFHAITRPDGRKTKGFGAVAICEGVWIASGVKIYKNVTIPPHCVIGADTIMHKSPDCSEKTIISTAKVSESYHYSPGWRDIEDDRIQYNGTQS